ncbi:hypothetical protein JIX56_29665 [Streptomyces sp. CA-210063]|uniref:hypothetical protein n=1 Tax=Streptomyces sp. CA-210063 TaxID=2801029 RepID=UPI00214AA240|nr:hypothetical protein [Streptomyces sp. CA-210063]UUU33682.1 hypothetical protein JIX56_29665 [Streptomyces sp. CA-210063]
MAAVALVSAVAACTGGEETRGAHSGTSSPTASKAPPALSAPELEMGFTEALSAGPTRGSDVFSPVPLQKGVTLIALDCVADSGSPMVDVVVDTVATFSTACKSGEVSYYAHELNLSTKRKGHVSIEAPDTVRWTMSVQVSKPDGT